jgi:hypothetical protein
MKVWPSLLGLSLIAVNAAARVPASQSSPEPARMSSSGTEGTGNRPGPENRSENPERRSSLGEHHEGEDALPIWGPEASPRHHLLLPAAGRIFPGIHHLFWRGVLPGRTRVMALPRSGPVPPGGTRVGVDRSGIAGRGWTRFPARLSFRGLGGVWGSGAPGGPPEALHLPAHSALPRVLQVAAPPHSRFSIDGTAVRVHTPVLDASALKPMHVHGGAAAINGTELRSKH